MATTTRVQWYLDSEAVDLVMARAGGERKMGAWVSAAIMAYAALLDATEESSRQCGTLEDISATLARVERRLIRLEAKAQP